VQPPVPADSSQKPFIGDKDIALDEEDQHEGEIRPASVCREEWLQNETDQYERDDKHQKTPSPFRQPCERGNESFSGLSIQPGKDRQSDQSESE